jgi:hypothetical protein
MFKASHRSHDPFDHVQPLRHELIAAIHDEDTPHVELNVVSLLLGLERIEGCTARHEQLH